LFDKTIILKPSASTVTTFEKFIVCKNFHYNENISFLLKQNYFKLLVFLKKNEKNNITSILNYEIPCYFTTKLFDINITLGQQQLESLNLVISLLKNNKNREEKIEILKKANIQKSVAWCEKYKVPYNKFTEKINMFLPIIVEKV
jgi:hypothetical protein